MARVLAVLAACGFGCTGGVEPVACATSADCSAGEVCRGGGCEVDKSLCPTLAPTFASVNGALLQPSCGAKTTGCHSAGSLATGRLDLETDPFTALLGDGTGAPAATATGRPAGLKLVKPGDADNSFLVQKLLIQTSTPALGAGMPPATPRALCPEAIEAVRAWIADGAKKN